MVKHYYRNTNAIVLVYDVTNTSSFDSLKKWIDECHRNCLYDIPRILVGNKCDGVAAVQTNVAQKFADQHNMAVSDLTCFNIIGENSLSTHLNIESSCQLSLDCQNSYVTNIFIFQLFETSARSDSQCDNIEGIFLTLAHKLKNQKPFLPISDNIRIQAVPKPSKSWWCC